MAGTPACRRSRPIAKGLATRDSSGQVLNALAESVPWLLGGAADLSPSTKTTLTFSGAFEPDDRGGRNFHFGIREHASAAISNGMSVTKLRPFWSGFLIFSDYARGAIRLSSLMEIPVIHIFTHDSIGVGEDGPTHQPVEQLASLRAIPGMLVFRPADANEVVECWRIIAALRHAAGGADPHPPGRADVRPHAARCGIRRHLAAPTCWPMRRTVNRTCCCWRRAPRSRWRCRPATSWPPSGINARVVSMTCWELFERQPQSYRDSVLPPSVKARVAIEQASTLGWGRYVGDDGRVIGMHTFGASAPLKALLDKFGFTPDKVSEIARECVAAHWREHVMKASEMLHQHGQSLWLDNIKRSLLDNGQIQRYIDQYSVTGLTSNPSIFDEAIGSGDYDDAIRGHAADGLSTEELFFVLAIEDLQRAADLFLPIHERTDGVDGWVSLEVSPELAYDTQATVEAAKSLHARAARTQSVHQDPRHGRGSAGDHRGSRGRRAGQCHAAVLRRPVPGGRRCLPEGRRTAHRAGSRSCRRLRRLRLHLPLGQGRGRPRSSRSEGSPRPGRRR